ncbi:MAG: sulfatase [Verrucomicrobiota bacterium]
MKFVLPLFFFLIASASAAPKAHLGEASRFSVLLIAIDDMNDWVTSLGGHPNAHTPNIDRLAKRGTLFTNAHCQAPICNPSRTSIMYGLRPSTSGIYANSPTPWKTPSLAAYTTMPRWFAQHGYHTATTGKIYHGSGLPENDFDLVGPRPGQRNKDLDQRLVPTTPGGASGLWDFGAQNYEEALYTDYECATWAIDFLTASPTNNQSQITNNSAKKNNGNETPTAPFFLAVGFYRPHVPFYAPTRVLEQYPLEQITLPKVKQNDRNDLPEAATEVTHNGAPPPHSWFVENKMWKPAVQAYLACIQWTDEQVGRVLDALDASPHADNTIVVLYSDHGFHLGEKLRWTKFSLWERSTRVPFIIAAPGYPEDQRCAEATELLSIYPTLIELCGLPANPDVEGHSLVPLLKNANADWPHHALTTHGQNNHALRSDRYRYIQYHDGSQELYDMQKDPDEWTNLVAKETSPKHAAIIDDFKRALPESNAAAAKATPAPGKPGKKKQK